MANAWKKCWNSSGSYFSRIAAYSFSSASVDPMCVETSIAMDIALTMSANTSTA